MSSHRESGGLKNFFIRAGRSFQAGGGLAKETGWWLAQKAARVGLIVATTAMVTMMPLLLEIVREGQMIETEKSLVKDYRGKGYADRQLLEMGFSDAAVHRPSVALLNKK